MYRNFEKTRGTFSSAQAMHKTFNDRKRLQTCKWTATRRSGAEMKDVACFGQAMVRQAPAGFRVQ